MSLMVNTNVAALNAQRQLFDSSNKLATAFERLSSGFRINRASDDAAGLQISDRMTSQIQGLDQAARNANDGISLVQTAEGALSETTVNLQRIRQLAVQAQNGINNIADKQALNKEAIQLLSEINRISEQTQFAGNNLLDGTFSATFLVGANAGQTISVGLTQFSAAGFGSQGLGVNGLNLQSGRSLNTINGSDVSGATPQGGGSFADMSFQTPSIGNEGEYKFALSSDGVTYNEFSVDLLNSSTPGASNINAQNLANAINSTGVVSASYSGSTVSISTTSQVYPAESLSNPVSIFGGAIGTYSQGDVVPGGEILATIDGAISRVGGVRADLGATQNRFQSTIRNLSNISENVRSARSQIKDTDYAASTAELTKQQIIQQASTTVLGQANQLPQAALILLR